MLAAVRVLVVEDDMRMAAAVRRALRGAGVVAEGGVAAEVATLEWIRDRITGTLAVEE